MSKTPLLRFKASRKLCWRGTVDSLTITDAQGNANTQIQQIQSMIDAKLDAIIVDAGSATALDRVIADACSKGIAVTNFDSLVDTKDLTTKIDTDQQQWGKLAAEWLVKQLNGKGNILVSNGPAGVSVSDDRRKGAEPVFKANPGIKILAETNTPYNAAPAQEAVTNLLFSNPQIDGVWSQGGVLSAGAVTAFEKQGRKLVPITGENYRPFLEMWKQKKLTAWATQQPNWLAAFAVYAAVKGLQGNDIPAYIDVPLPIIDEANLDSYLAQAKDFAADGYIDNSPYDTKVNSSVTLAEGRAEPQAAVTMVEEIPGQHRITLGADKGYDRKEFVQELRDHQVTPHIARSHQHHR